MGLVDNTDYYCIFNRVACLLKTYLFLGHELYMFLRLITSVIYGSFHPQVGIQKVARSPGLTLENMKWPSPDDEIPFWESRITTSDVTIEAPLSADNDSNLTHIVHVTAEMAPIAKVGGLGDVVTGLARACLSRGHTVDIMLPFYECLPKQQMTELNLICTFDSYHDGNWVPTNAYRAVTSGIPVILIEPTNRFFKGPRIYGGSYDELEAYLFFCRACLEYMQVCLMTI